MSLLARHTNWRRTWNAIVSGTFVGIGEPSLLFYERQVLRFLLGLLACWSVACASAAAQRAWGRGPSHRRIHAA